MSSTYLKETNVEDLGRMLITLLSEFWALRDRTAILEEMLQSKGVVEPGSIDNFVWSESKAEEMEVLRDQIISAVLGAPIAAKERSIDQILARAGLERP